MLLSYEKCAIFMQVAAEKNCNSDKGNVTQGAQNLKGPSKRGHKTTKLSRPVRTKIDTNLLNLIVFFEHNCYMCNGDTNLYR